MRRCEALPVARALEAAATGRQGSAGCSVAVARARSSLDEMLRPDGLRGPRPRRQGIVSAAAAKPRGACSGGSGGRGTGLLISALSLSASSLSSRQRPASPLQPQLWLQQHREGERMGAAVATEKRGMTCAEGLRGSREEDGLRGGDDGNHVLLVLDCELDGDAEALPLLGCLLGDVLPDLLRGEDGCCRCDGEEGDDPHGGLARFQREDGLRDSGEEGDPAEMAAWKGLRGCVAPKRKGTLQRWPRETVCAAVRLWRGRR